MKLLLLSNSTNSGEKYLGYSKKIIADFLDGFGRNIIFIPYAGVTLEWDEYAAMVNSAIKEVGLNLKPIHYLDDPVRGIKEASAVIVGGGNSFNLLKYLYDYQLVELTRQRVVEGIPYIGWSAGANMACPTLMTTNDMPIVEPPSFKALGLINFQINPHYTEEVLPNHGGESREMRIAEFIEVNRDMPVIGLPEGMILKVTDGNIHLIGEKGCKAFRYGLPSGWIHHDKELNEFLNNRDT